MNYNFDEIINRNGTDSVKWDAVESRWGRNDLIPMCSSFPSRDLRPATVS